MTSEVMECMTEADDAIHMRGEGERVAHVSPVGAVLKQWRTYRRMSQLDLAAHAEISTRHLSCVETGKSRASPEMLLVLASALEMPLEERNRLLQAGGYAPAYPNSDVSPASGEVDRALRVILDGVDPNPTLVVNSRWDLVRLNRGAATLFSAVSPGFGDLLASVRGTAPVSVLALPPLNLMHVMLNDPGVKRALLDWEDVVAVTVDRLHREAAAYPGPDGPAETLRACLAAPDIPNRLRRPELAHPPRAFVQLRFSVPTASRSLAFFTTLSTLGTTIDVAASRLMIETYFPADEFTRDWLSEHVE